MMPEYLIFQKHLIAYNMTSKIRHKEQLTDLEWIDSAHTGTPNKIAGFGGSGEAVEIDIPSLPLEITGITLLVDFWTLVGSLYEYDLANASITANHVVDVIPENADIAIVKAAEILPKTISSAGSVKLYATNAPTGNIGVTIILTKATT